MSRRRGQNSKQAKPSEPRLDHRQFPELNAMFYRSDPAGYLYQRIQMLALWLCSDDQLESAATVENRIGIIAIGGTGLPSLEVRRSFVATEATAVFHHAAETLLRMFFAHVEHQDCPWLGIVQETNFAEFKAKLGRCLDTGFNRDDIATVFLGGTSVADAQLHLSEEDFEDGVDAVAALLTYCAVRFTEESFLYNAVKHGLSGITIDESTISVTRANGQRVQLHKGNQIGYLHKNRRPADTKEPTKWFFSATGTLPDQDLAMSVFVFRALESLWNVAQRRYLGEAGTIGVLSKASIDMCAYSPVTQSMNIVRSFIFELAKVDDQGEPMSPIVTFAPYRIPPDWVRPEAGYHAEPTRHVDLVVRQRDRRVHSTGQRFALPFSPRGFQRV